MPISYSSSHGLGFSGLCNVYSVLERQGDALLPVDEVVWRGLDRYHFSLKNTSLLLKKPLTGIVGKYAKKSGRNSLTASSPGQPPITKVRC